MTERATFRAGGKTVQHTIDYPNEGALTIRYGNEYLGIDRRHDLRDGLAA